jgi:hypothetical protein
LGFVLSAATIPQPHFLVIPRTLSLPRTGALKKFLPRASIFLAMPDRYDYLPLAQIRTCLWPCVDR